jgi:signal transduction histidine kinase
MVKRDTPQERDQQPQVSTSGELKHAYEVSASGVIVADEAVSSSRSVVLPDVPSRWLDRLLVASAELPVAHGEIAVVRAVLEAVAGSVTQVSLGAIVGGHVIRIPDEPPAAKGDRLFPSLAHERVVRVPDEPDATLHVASNDALLDDESSAPVQLLQRAAFIVRHGLAAARTHAQNDRMHQEVHAREALLIQAEKLATLGQLAAGMVHELNNPLTSILAYTDFLHKRALARTQQDPDELERLRRIGESAHRMLRFTRDLVQYARPIDVRGPVVVSSVIEQALSFCEHLLDEMKVDVDRRLGDGVLPVRGAAEQLAQVFVNLFTNACHAMPKGGRLVIVTEVAADETYVRIHVEDTGHGIDQENLEHVFQPFFTTKHDGRGSGLGLSIVKSIVEQHEGSIEVDSKIGHGTRFSVTLPVAIQDRPSRM